MRPILVTGFEPFGSYPVNPTKDVVERLSGTMLAGRRVEGLVLRCAYNAFEVLRPVMESMKPSAVVSMGLASRVMGIRVETIGINAMQSKYADADGLMPQGDPIEPDGPHSVAACSSGIDVVAAIHGRGIPVELSADADRFVCNALLYQTARHIRRQTLDVRNVFFHASWTEAYRRQVEIEPDKTVLPDGALELALEEIIRVTG